MNHLQLLERQISRVEETIRGQWYAVHYYPLSGECEKEADRIARAAMISGVLQDAHRRIEAILTDHAATAITSKTP